MASPNEAFRRFFSWKNSQTVLNLIEVTESGARNKRIGQIYHVDEQQSVVGFADAATREVVPLSFRDADFVVTDRSVEASRPGEGRLILEEALVS
jgi:hypothetical protein